MKEILLTSSVLILALLALRRLFRRTVSRRMQYALWLLVLVRLLVPVNVGTLAHNVLSAAAPVQAALHLDAPIAFAAAHLPLFDKNLGWLLPAVIGFAAGMAIRVSRRQTPTALS